MTFDESVKQFDKIIDLIPEIERKGKGSPFTSLNGNMYTMLRKDGVLGIRLSKEDRELFILEHKTIPFENYGSKIKEYVEVPESVFFDTETMVMYLKKSHAYTKTLKKKATKKAEKKPPKKITADVNKTYKNGQIKAEIIEDKLFEYFEDGSIKSEGHLVKGEMNGKWLFNRKGGQLLQEGNYIEGIKNGEWIRYDSNDQIVYHVVFKNGKVIEKKV